MWKRANGAGRNPRGRLNPCGKAGRGMGPFHRELEVLSTGRSVALEPTPCATARVFHRSIYVTIWSKDFLRLKEK